MCDDCTDGSGCPQFVEVNADKIDNLAESLSRIEFSRSLQNIELTVELCKEFLQPFIGQTLAFEVFEQMFDEFVFKKEVDAALFDMAESGEISMSVDDDGQETFFANAEEGIPPLEKISDEDWDAIEEFEKRHRPNGQEPDPRI